MLPWGRCVWGMGRSEEGRTEGRGQSAKGSVGQDKQFILGGTGSPWGNLSRKAHYLIHVLKRSL